MLGDRTPGLTDEAGEAGEADLADDDLARKTSDDKVLTGLQELSFFLALTEHDDGATDEDVTNTIAVYNAVVDELIGHLRIIAETSVQDRAELPRVRFDWLADRLAFLERVRNSYMPPSPLLLEATLRRMTNAPAPVRNAKADAAAEERRRIFGEDRPGVARVRASVRAIRQILSKGALPS